MNEVVRDAVDIPRNADRVDEAKNDHDPERYPGKEIEHPEEIDAVENRGEYGKRVPARVRKNPRICLRRGTGLSESDQAAAGQKRSGPCALARRVARNARTERRIDRGSRS